MISDPSAGPEACLPADLRTASTTITKIAAGLSGGGVYRVEADGRPFVLKVSRQDQPLQTWRRVVGIQQDASRAGLAPHVIHVDESRRAIVTAFVVDRSFLAYFGDPRTRETALAQLGRTLRGVHDLPLPADAESKAPWEFLSALRSGPLESFKLPSFARDALQQVLAETPPDSQDAPVLSHNDVNPTNLIYDGENLLLLDWETAGPNDRYYDLAVAALFLRMDRATCQRLVSAHDGRPVEVLPARFEYFRRLAAGLCGAIFLNLARESGHPGAAGDETFESSPSMIDVYKRMRSGSLTIASAEGQWNFGLALVKDGSWL